MNRTELLRRVREKTGHHITPPTLYYVIAAGHVDEAPKNALNRAVYDERHFRQLLSYVRTRRGTTKKGRGGVEVTSQRRKTLAAVRRREDN